METSAFDIYHHMRWKKSFKMSIYFHCQLITYIQLLFIYFLLLLVHLYYYLACFILIKKSDKDKFIQTHSK